MLRQFVERLVKGGPGSGNFNHVGIPGQQGGSARNAFEFRDSTLDAHDGQTDNVLQAQQDGQEAGRLEYSVFDGSPHIDVVFS
jgi:hypothetical protein